jgi:hypothetical protein
VSPGNSGADWLDRYEQTALIAVNAIGIDSYMPAFFDYKVPASAKKKPIRFDKLTPQPERRRVRL